MATYIGSYYVYEQLDHDIGRKLAAGELSLPPGGIPEPVATKARELPGKLPGGCKIVGSYVPLGTRATADCPGMMIVETDDVSNLAWITNYYGGLIEFRWQQYVPLARQPG